MFNFMIFILLSSFWITLILGNILNFVSRINIINHDQYEQKEKFAILLLPFSYGVFKYAKESKYKDIHRMFVIIFFITAFIASLFLFYMNAEVGIY